MPNPVEQKYLDLLRSCLCGSLYEESGWEVLREKYLSTRSQDIGFRLKAVIWNGLIRFLGRRNKQIVEIRQMDLQKREMGTDWPFIGMTMIGHRRMKHLECCVLSVLDRKIPGDFLEAGVWRGGSAILMKAVLDLRGERSRRVICADSFRGLPRPTSPKDVQLASPDLSSDPYLAVSLNQVRRNFERFGLYDDQVEFIEGWFCDSLVKAQVGPLAILRIDCDLYESTRDVLNALYSKVGTGGIVIVDDYASWPACKVAVDEFRLAHQIQEPLQKIDEHGVFWEIGGP